MVIWRQAYLAAAHMVILACHSAVSSKLPATCAFSNLSVIPLSLRRTIPAENTSRYGEYFGKGQALRSWKTKTTFLSFHDQWVPAIIGKMKQLWGY